MNQNMGQPCWQGQYQPGVHQTPQMVAPTNRPNQPFEITMVEETGRAAAYGQQPQRTVGMPLNGQDMVHGQPMGPQQRCFTGQMQAGQAAYFAQPQMADGQPWPPGYAGNPAARQFVPVNGQIQMVPSFSGHHQMVPVNNFTGQPLQMQPFALPYPPGYISMPANGQYQNVQMPPQYPTGMQSTALQQMLGQQMPKRQRKSAKGQQSAPERYHPYQNYQNSTQQPFQTPPGMSFADAAAAYGIPFAVEAFTQAGFTPMAQGQGATTHPRNGQAWPGSDQLLWSMETPNTAGASVLTPQPSPILRKMLTTVTSPVIPGQDALPPARPSELSSESRGSISTDLRTPSFQNSEQNTPTMPQLSPIIPHQEDARPISGHLALTPSSHVTSPLNSTVQTPHAEIQENIHEERKPEIRYSPILPAVKDFDYMWAAEPAASQESEIRQAPIERVLEPRIDEHILKKKIKIKIEKETVVEDQIEILVETSSQAEDGGQQKEPEQLEEVAGVNPTTIQQLESIIDKRMSLPAGEQQQEPENLEESMVVGMNSATILSLIDRRIEEKIKERFITMVKEGCQAEEPATSGLKPVTQQPDEQLTEEDDIPSSTPWRYCAQCRVHGRKSLSKLCRKAKPDGSRACQFAGCKCKGCKKAEAKRRYRREWEKKRRDVRRGEADETGDSDSDENGHLEIPVQASGRFATEKEVINEGDQDGGQAETNALEPEPEESQEIPDEEQMTEEILSEKVPEEETPQPWLFCAKCKVHNLQSSSMLCRRKLDNGSRMCPFATCQCDNGCKEIEARRRYNSERVKKITKALRGQSDTDNSDSDEEYRPESPREIPEEQTDGEQQPDKPAKYNPWLYCGKCRIHGEQNLTKICRQHNGRGCPQYGCTCFECKEIDARRARASKRGKKRSPERREQSDTDNSDSDGEHQPESRPQKKKLPEEQMSKDLPQSTDKPAKYNPLLYCGKCKVHGELNLTKICRTRTPKGRRQCPNDKCKCEKCKKIEDQRARTNKYLKTKRMMNKLF